MRNLAILALFIAFALGDDKFENITNAFQLRNAKTGIAINLQRKLRQFDTQNWFLKELGHDKIIAKKDKFALSLPFGYVQFANVKEKNMCLSVAPSGFLALKNCEDDIKTQSFESIFSIIPTSTGAVQIRSLLLETNECLSAFNNPNIAIEDRVGLVPCILEFFSIDVEQLWFIAPPLGGASVIGK